MRKRTAALIITGATLVGLTALGAHTERVPGHSAPAFATCADDLGETPGQAFPCYWPGGGQDEPGAYVLVAPYCDVICATQVRQA